MDKQPMWVDSARCTGCGLCVEVCPAGAISMAAGKAHVDQENCTGCAACAAECAVDAIQPVLQGELVSVPERPAPTPYRPSPLAEAAGAAVAVAGTGLLVRVAGALGRAVARWLARRPTGGARPHARGVSPTGERTGGGRRVRRRRGR